VYAVVQDTGGIHAVLPVVRQLREAEIEVALWCHDGVERYKKNDLVGLYPELLQARAATKIRDFGDLSDVDLVITSLCSGTGGAGRLLASAGHMLGIPVVGIQDCWDINLQGGKEAGWQGRNVLPTMIVLPHQVCVDYTRRAWPAMQLNQIFVAWPAMDRFHGRNSNRETHAARLKARLEISGTSGPLVAIMTGVRDPVPLLEGALAALAGGDTNVLFKPHPRLEKENPEGFQRVRELCHEAGSQVRWVTSADIPDNDGLVQGVTAVVAKASTTLIEAAFVGTVGIAYGDADNTPFVRMGAVPLARSPDELKTLISRAVNNELTSELANAWRSLHTDGQDAERVAEHIIRTFLSPGDPPDAAAA
jgi:hypothetical protein